MRPTGGLGHKGHGPTKDTLPSGQQGEGVVTHVPSPDGHGAGAGEEGEVGLHSEESGAIVVVGHVEDVREAVGEVEKICMDSFPVSVPWLQHTANFNLSAMIVYHALF